MSQKSKLHIMDFKKAIIRFVKEKQKLLAKTFALRQSAEYLAKALMEKNWVRTDKYYPVSYDYEIIHEFDCRPYHGELKGYVYTTVDEREIVNVVVQTE